MSSTLAWARTETPVRTSRQPRGTNYEAPQPRRVRKIKIAAIPKKRVAWNKGTGMSADEMRTYKRLKQREYRSRP